MLEEIKLKISKSMKGKVPINHFKKGNIPWNKGKIGLQKHSEESKRKISESKKGKPISTINRPRLLNIKYNDELLTLPQKEFIVNDKVLKRREYYKQYRQRNKEKLKQLNIKYLQINNYKSEKTPRQKAIRHIKRVTRKYYPLSGKQCEFCFNPATEHHHYTNPIRVDKFNYVCHECHNKIKNSIYNQIKTREVT